MFRFGSLRIRIIVLTTVPLIGILVTILLSTATSVDGTVRRRVHKSLTEAGSVFVRMLETQRRGLESMAQVTARDPRFFATFSVPPRERGDEFVPTLEGVAIDFLRITDADFLEVFNAQGRFILRVDRDRTHVAGGSGDREQAVDVGVVASGASVGDCYRDGEGVIVSGAAPVYVMHRLEGVVRLGSYLDRAFVEEVRRLTGADVWLAHGGEVLVATLGGGSESLQPAGTATRPAAVHFESMTLSDVFSIDVAGDEYLSVRATVRGADGGEGFDAFLGRELQAELLPMIDMERRLALLGALAVLLTLIVGSLAANTITRPLQSIVKASVAMRDGVYDAPIDKRGRDEVAVLGRNFSEMRESLQTHMRHLERIDQVKSNFIALAGHELRTPLTVITGFNEMIGSGTLGEVPDKIKETTQVISEQLSDLNRLVQSMLDLSYLEQGLANVELVTVDATAAVAEALSRRSEIVGSRRLQLETRLDANDIFVRADRERLIEAVLHLVDNAIRFTPDNGVIGVGVRRRDDDAVITVSDTGVGIPPNEINWIFDKVYEVGDILRHSSGRHAFGSRGFGLGLALCRAIVDVHGGRIDVRSVPGRGSTFTIVLSLTDAPDPVVTAPAMSAREEVLI